MLRSFLLLCFFIPILVLTAIAQSPQVLQRLSGPIKFDGVVNEPVWLEIEPLPLAMSSPTFKGTPTEHTEIRIAYDDQYFYAAGKFFDGDPKNLRSNSLTRDGASPQDDLFAIIIDTFNDNENALGFFTTPAGTRSDLTVFNDAEPMGREPMNSSWNTFWDVQTTQDDSGWYAELRIPFSSLRFEEKEGKVTMGLITWRYYPRKNETVTFPEIPPKSPWGILKPSYAQDIALSGVKEQKPIYVTPYILGGGGYSHSLNDSETQYIKSKNTARDVGLDIKYSLSSNLTLDLTLNTDFAQIEVDDQQINLSRFSLFFPEKRLFFQERSSTFDFNMGGPNRVFYSRQIGISEKGPVRILGGARLVGRLGKWDVGLLNMQTEKSETLPAENFGVLRLRRQIVNENSYAGGIFTSRIGSNGQYNLVYGLDAILRMSGDDYVILNWVQTFDDSLLTAKKINFFNSSRGRIQFERRNFIGFSYDVGISRSSEHYNPAIGFSPRTDVTRIGDRISYGWYLEKSSILQSHVLSWNASMFIKNADGVVETAELGPYWGFSFKNGSEVTISFKSNLEDFDESFDLSDEASVLAGRYWFSNGTLSYRSPFGLLFRYSAFVDGGSFYDGWRVTPGVSPNWTISEHFEIGGEYLAHFIRFPDRQQEFTVHIGRIRTRWTFNKETFLSAFVQFNSATSSLGWNIRLRYNPREGNDLYVVYDEGMNTDPLRFNPRLPRNDNRTLLLKYSYTFTF